MEDAKLAERAREGDTAAYERLVRMHQAVAFRAAFLVTGDAQEAEDAVQEAFVKAYRALGRFRPGAPFRPWLLTIVANEARNRRRSAGRRANLTLRAAQEGSSVAVGDLLPLLPRVLGGGDGSDPRVHARHGQVQALAGAGQAA